MRCRSLKIYKRNEREGLCFQGSIQIETSIGPSCLSTSKEILFVDQHGRSKNQRRLYKSDLRFRNWTVMKVGGKGRFVHSVIARHLHKRNHRCSNNKAKCFPY
uniref:Uncharacterized protein n=1 Tax=Brassica oleracea TaxID=3712 RepID=A0A3P6G372_BRAOL|nr:unnamed protein product [Brassica oleracea]